MHYLKLSDFVNGTEKDYGKALRECFLSASEYSEAIITIEAGEYPVDSEVSIPLCSHLKVFAEGAVFKFPQDLGNNIIRRMFYGENIEDFYWYGGRFEGYVYDVENKQLFWPPYAYTGCICIRTTENGKTENIHISNVTASGIAGAVINVEGCEAKKAVNIDVKDCQFIKCGRFMWDYGYLWQKVVFADAYDAEIVSNAMENLPKRHISSEVKLNKDGSIYADYMPGAIPNERDAVTFFGPELPKEIKRGKQYFVLNKMAENSLYISETENGNPIKIDDIPHGTRLIRNMFYIFHDLFCPFNCIDRKSIKGRIPDAEKGSINILYSRNITVTGCRISAVGDSMHISTSDNVVFSDNQILGSRMGAFYIGFHCNNVTVTGNTVYGTNGSRTVSVEYGTQNITIVGNTFSGGGRGCWFNKTRNAVISDNIFIQNTNKCVKDINTGRMCHVTGDFEKYPELYFTSRGDTDEYGPIIIRGNIIKTRGEASAAIAFNPGGKDIIIEGNIIKGDMRDIHIASGCEEPLMINNIGIDKILDKKFINTANSR